MAGGSSDAFGGGDEPGGMIVDINVTPLVDITLVLLIIFMVTASYIVSPVDQGRPAQGGLGQRSAEDHAGADAGQGRLAVPERRAQQRRRRRQVHRRHASQQSGSAGHHRRRHGGPSRRGRSRDRSRQTRRCTSLCHQRRPRNNRRRLRQVSRACRRRAARRDEARLRPARTGACAFRRPAVAIGGRSRDPASARLDRAGDRDRRPRRDRGRAAGRESGAAPAPRAGRRDGGAGAAAAAAGDPPGAAAAATAGARAGAQAAHRAAAGGDRRAQAAAADGAPPPPNQEPPKPTDAPPVFGVTLQLDGRGRQGRHGRPRRQHADDQGPHAGQARRGAAAVGRRAAPAPSRRWPTSTSPTRPGSCTRSTAPTSTRPRPTRWASRARSCSR